MKKWVFVLFLLALIVVVDDSESVSAKSSANKKADKAYMKLVKKICEEERTIVNYYFIDMTGDGVHEAIIQYHPQDGGSGDVFQIYSYESGKTKLILDDMGYGIYRLDVYKESQTFIMFKAGHGHESQTYYNMVDGMFKYVLMKGRPNAEAEIKPWSYSSYQSDEKISKSKFKKQVNELCKGKKKKIDCKSSYSSYYEVS